MNKQIIKQEIENLKAAINEQQDQILTYEGKIPQIEFDILMNNIRKQYELFSELNKAPQPVKVENHDEKQIFNEELLAADIPLPVVSTPVIPENVISEIKKIEEKPEETVVNALTEKSGNGLAHVQPELLVTVVENKKQEVHIEPVLTSQPIQQVIAAERVKEFNKPSSKISATASLFDDAPTVAGKFQGTKTVREKIAGSNDDKSIGERHQQHPVADLKKSIGINEKFSFINELFDGDPENYNAAIDQLNRSGSISEAMDILSTGLAPKYSWTTSGESYLQLKNLVERRFTV